MSSEQRTATQAAIAGLLGFAAALGLITADQAQAYVLASIAGLGALSLVWTAVNTWRQRPDNVDVDHEVDRDDHTL